jgi:hypothetical protein
MPLHQFKEAELRQFCKEYIESLELWLRRIIDETLTAIYGQNYLDYKNKDGSNLISNTIKNEIEQRRQAEPDRFPRPIDACLLESEIKIITNPVLYEAHFKQVFQSAFPEGREEFRTFLTRLIDPRNKLFHSNPITVREAERVICYTNDIIDAIKDYYKATNVNQEYNVPLIIKYSDNFGNVLHRNQFHGNTIVGGKYIDFTNSKTISIRPGDTISIEMEIDPTFSKEEYSIKWIRFAKDQAVGNKLVYKVQVKDVGQTFGLSASIISNNEWHRLGDFDDMLVVKFKVLPPL